MSYCYIWYFSYNQVTTRKGSNKYKFDLVLNAMLKKIRHLSVCWAVVLISHSEVYMKAGCDSTEEFRPAEKHLFHEQMGIFNVSRDTVYDVWIWLDLAAIGGTPANLGSGGTVTDSLLKVLIGHAHNRKVLTLQMYQMKIVLPLYRCPFTNVWNENSNLFHLYRDLNTKLQFQEN